VRKYYAPTVIPIVQSKNSMVIVGAVLRKDLQESLNKLKKFAEVASAAPVREFIFAIFLDFAPPRFCVYTSLFAHIRLIVE